MGTRAVRVEAFCEVAACSHSPGPLYDFAIAIYSSEVTIEEDVPPTVGELSVTGGSGGWANGSSVVGFGGSDTLGIRKFEVLRGNDVAATVNRTCVDWSVLPCSEPSAGLSQSANGSKTIDALDLADGTYALRARATDAAGNTATSAVKNVTVDRYGYDVATASGDGTTSGEQRTLTWTISGDGAPVQTASAHLCTGTGPTPSSCQDIAVGATGPLTFALPGDGSTATATISLTDAAGNTTTSNTYKFARDTAAPSAPGLALAAANGNDRAVAVSGEAGATITAKLCAVGGACTDLPKATAPATITATLPVAGEYDLTATLTDRSGNTSPSATLRLTRSAPLDEPKSIGLTVRVTSNLHKRKISLRGSVAAGSTSTIAVRLIGKRRTGRRVISHATITVPASGKFAKQLRPPAGASPNRPVELVLTPTPTNTGWRVTRYTHTIRP